MQTPPSVEALCTELATLRAANAELHERVRLLLAEQTAVQVVTAAVKFIEDSEPSMAPPSDAWNACYWHLRAAVHVYQKALTAATEAGERDA